MKVCIVCALGPLSVVLFFALPTFVRIGHQTMQRRNARRFEANRSDNLIDHALARDGFRPLPNRQGGTDEQ